MNLQQYNNLLQWIEALESGNYRQGIGALEDQGAFCCMGVAAKISGIPSVPSSFVSLDNGSIPASGRIKYGFHEGATAAEPDYFRGDFPPDSWLVERFDLPIGQGAILMTKNDTEELPFPQIAAHLRTFLPSEPPTQ